MIEVCQLPEEWLKTDTGSLFCCVLTYPLLIDVFAWSSFKEGVEEVSTYFNGMQELLNRKDLVKVADTLNIDSIIFSQEYQKYLAKKFISFLPYYLNGMQESFSSRSIEVTNNNVLTPNNTQVPHYENLTWNDHLMDQDDAEMEAYAVNATYSVSPIHPFNPKYNCHSYAWHSSSTSNIYWIDNPSDYWEDDSYYRVYSTLVNYRVIYYRSDRPKPYNHSGIVYSTSGSITIESKWHYLGVYRHSLTNCPYYRSGYTSFRYYTRDGE